VIRVSKLFFTPPMAIARVGGSSIPLESYTWREDPSCYGAGKTVVEPCTSLEVQADGSVIPYLPSFIRFKDGDRIRPVAPFLELWSSLESEDGSKQDVPLNLAVLERIGATVESVSYQVHAANLKAAYRTGDPACGFEAWQHIAGGDFTPVQLRAVSPKAQGSVPLVSDENPIHLGTFRPIKPIPRCEMGVDLSTIRCRFIPARGEVYGPPTTKSAPAPYTRRIHEVVRDENRILNPQSSWLEYDGDWTRYRNPIPAETYDGSAINNNVSWGVVDDSCELVIEAFLAVREQRFRAVARVFSAPPDFAPDRRPFVSLADELTDRECDLPPVTPETETCSLAEVADLFQRVFETASLLNVDVVRLHAIDLNSDEGIERRTKGFPLTDARTMTRFDKPFADKTAEMDTTPVIRDRVPYSSIASAVHAPLADTEIIADFLRTHGERLKQILRPPYAAFEELHARPRASSPSRHRDPRVARDRMFDMRMPPYMRDSDGTALSLTRRQYFEVMALMDFYLKSSKPKNFQAAAKDVKQSAPSWRPNTPVALHVEQVVARLSGQGKDTSNDAQETANNIPTKRKLKPMRKTKRLD